MPPAKTQSTPSINKFETRNPKQICTNSKNLKSSIQNLKSNKGSRAHPDPTLIGRRNSRQQPSDGPSKLSVPWFNNSPEVWLRTTDPHVCDPCNIWPRTARGLGIFVGSGLIVPGSFWPPEFPGKTRPFLPLGSSFQATVRCPARGFGSRE